MKRKSTALVVTTVALACAALGTALTFAFLPIESSGALTNQPIQAKPAVVATTPGSTATPKPTKTPEPHHSGSSTAVTPAAPHDANDDHGGSSGGSGKGKGGGGSDDGGGDDSGGGSSGGSGKHGGGDD